MTEAAQQKPVIRVAVMGSGAWGTTLSMVAHRAGADVSLIVRNPAVAATMAESRQHPRSLRGIAIPRPITITANAPGALADAQVVIVAIPTQQLRSGIGQQRDHLAGKTLVCAAKGIEMGTKMLPHEIIADALKDAPPRAICALSGPNLATEIARGLPATAVIASTDAEAAGLARQALMGAMFRVYTSDDMVGVEIGGALKNIIAIGAGIADGLNAGDNAKASFLTRGIVEISRLGVAMGAQPITFAGLSGIGDLMATCASSLSRNHRVGAGIASGKSLNEVLAGLTEVAEGVDTTRAALELAASRGVDMPITRQIHDILFEGKPPITALADLMLREPRQEHGDLTAPEDR